MRHWMRDPSASQIKRSCPPAKIPMTSTAGPVTTGPTRTRRIDFQLEQTGKQMWEIARTRAFGYSVVNLDHLIDLGLMGRHYGIDLFSYASLDGRSIQRSLDFLIPFATGEDDWLWERVKHEEDSGERFALTLFKASAAFSNPLYRDKVNELVNLDKTEFSSHRVHLLFPE